MKKVISFLFAFSMLSNALLSLPTSAMNVDISDVQTIWTLSEGEYGTAIVDCTMKNFSSFIAVADSAIDTVSSDENIKSIEEISSVENAEFLATWDEESAGKLLEYGSDVKYYEIKTQSTGNIYDLPVIARKFMMNHKEVKNVYCYQCSFSGEPELTEKMIMWVNETASQEEKENYKKQYEAEDSPVFQEIKQQYQENQAQIAQWESTVNVNYMSKEEVFLARKENGLPSDYELVKPFFDFAESVTQKYTAVDAIEVDLDLKEKNEDGEKVFSIISAWDNIGNLNSDERINAADASKILVASAQNGAGNDTGLSTEEQQFADVNADGVFNAVDASLILQYSACVGCGDFSGTLEEFITKK